MNNKSHETRWYKVDYKDNKDVHTGWIRDINFDDYGEKFSNFDVPIPTAAENPNGIHVTEDASDLAQNIVIDGDNVMGSAGRVRTHRNYIRTIANYFFLF